MFEDIADETVSVIINGERMDDIALVDDKTFKARNIFEYRFLSEGSQLDHEEMLKLIPDMESRYKIIASWYQETADIEMRFNFDKVLDNGDSIIPTVVK